MTNEITLIDGYVYTHDEDTPEQFRHEVDKKRLTKMIRNCDDCMVFAPTLDANAKVQKGYMLSLIAESEFDLFACIFNGIDLTILGAVDQFNLGSDGE